MMLNRFADCLTKFYAELRDLNCYIHWSEGVSICTVCESYLIKNIQLNKDRKQVADISDYSSS